MTTLDQIKVEEHTVCPEGLWGKETEDFRLLRTYDQSGIKDFHVSYLQVYRGDRPVSVMPYFMMEYRLDTMVPRGFIKRLVSPIRFKVACVGHPDVDIGKIDGEISKEILEAVNAHLFSKARMVAYKMFTQPLPLEGFSVGRGLPVAVLNIEGYFLLLRSNLRKNFRRRLAQSAALTFKMLSFPPELPDDLASAIFALVHQTEGRADIEFGGITKDYFQRVAPLSHFLLAFEGTRLIGVIQSIGKEGRMAAKYIGMDYERNRQYGVYFSMILKLIEGAEAAGYKEIEMGPTGYYFKKLLGCELIPTQIYYRHSHPFLNWVLGHCKFLLEPTASELR